MPARVPTPRERTLSREGIVDVALRVLDAEGIDALSMRRVATELGTGPASLYAHVRDKDDLYAAVFDRALGEIAVPERSDRRRWSSQLKAVMRDWRRVLDTHRDLARVGMGLVPIGENSLPAFERLLGIVLSSGIDQQTASWALDLLNLYVMAVAYEEAVENERDVAGAGHPQAEEIREVFAALPADRFPLLSAMAVPLTTGDRDDRFEFGLDLIVQGLAARAPR